MQMDDGEDDPRFQPKHFSNYNASLRPRRASRNQSYQVNTGYNEYDNEELDNGNQGYGDQEDDGEDDYGNGYFRGSVPEAESSRRPKKRRIENMAPNYEFAPRGNVNVQKEFYNAQDQPADWSEHATFVLLEVWGDRFLQLGRKSLRTDDWAEVAEKVSEMCKMEITDAQCQFRLEALKKKYKKEKAKTEEMGGGGYYGKWAFFKKMDMLLSSKKPYHGLPCGVDSGEYVFMNTRVYLNRSNALDEMRDSPGESESDADDPDDEEKEDDGSFKLLADSVQKFGEIYEKIESSKRQQVMELEKMRMDFQRELELQKKLIVDKAQEEIAKIRDDGDDDDDDDETDVSADDVSE